MSSPLPEHHAVAPLSDSAAASSGAGRGGSHRAESPEQGTSPSAQSPAASSHAVSSPRAAAHAASSHPVSPHAVSTSAAPLRPGSSPVGSNADLMPSRPASSAGMDALHHGAVEQAPHGGAVVSYNPDAPSEEWGWHGHWSDFAPRGRFLLLSLGVVGLLLMVIGNHQSHVEDYFLVLCALLMASWMFYTWRTNKQNRRIRP